MPTTKKKAPKVKRPVSIKAPARPRVKVPVKPKIIAKRRVPKKPSVKPRVPRLPLDFSDEGVNLSLLSGQKPRQFSAKEFAAKKRVLNAAVLGQVEKIPDKLRLPIPGKKRELNIPFNEAYAFQPPQAPIPSGFVDLGGLLVKPPKKDEVVVLPDLEIFKQRPLRRWTVGEWRIWDNITRFFPCASVPAKNARVEIAVGGSPAMVKVSADCSRAYVVNNAGIGSVVNVVTEVIDSTFTVAAHPSPSQPYPPGRNASNVSLSPFIKGGINHKYQRLYVPASFYSGDGTGGFFVSVVDVNPKSSTYLDTIDWVDCGWLPEQVSFTEDGETGVVANYMEGTVTVFRASDHAVLAEVPLFPGAGVDSNFNGTSGTLARSVTVVKLAGFGNVALATLTNTSPNPGFALIRLDDSSYPVTNFSEPSFGFIDGIAVSPQKDRILLVDGSNKSLQVYRIAGPYITFEKSIPLLNFPSRNYMGGIAVRPSGNLAFVANGRGTSEGFLTCVNYENDTAIDIPENLVARSWDVVIKSFGSPLKPHIFVASTGGALTIIPC